MAHWHAAAEQSVMEFRPFSKIPRLMRDCTITEKIDGTNASIYIEGDTFLTGSRNRWITPEDDNYGFSRWAHEHKDELLLLGEGHHFGEWWGQGCQRGYGLTEKRFSLFNTMMWGGLAARPSCCHVVPVLYEGPFTTHFVSSVVNDLQFYGSAAAPGFRDPEGIIIYHHAAGQYFKRTIKGDEEGKHADAHPKKERAPKPPGNPNKGGRRKEELLFVGPDRRQPK